MRELVEILAAFDSLRAAGKPAALATVVAVEGSAYRGPGARMLIAEDGRTWGGVSGGCLERDVAHRARGVIASGRPIRCRYDTADEEESGRAAATGCGGTIDLFIQPVAAASPGPLLYLGHVLREREPITLATIVAGGRAFVDSVGVSLAIGASDEVEHARSIANRLRALIGSRPIPTDAADKERLTCLKPLGGDGGANIEVFIEHVLPPLPLIIFGGGSDVIPLVMMAKSLGWHVTVVGSRPVTGLADRFAMADALRVTSAENPTEGVEIPPDAAVVVMTHDVARDGLILQTLHAPLRYLGLLGPRHRARRLLAELPANHPAIRSNFFAPVGLNLGSETPEQIALSIVAEIQKVIGGGDAHSLRDQARPIHLRPDRSLDDADFSRRPVCPA